MSKLKCIRSNIKMLKPSGASALSTPATQRITGRRCQQTRREVAEREGYLCQICKRLTVKGEVDHDVPLHMGGSESDCNRQWLCVECHAEKSKSEAASRGGK